MNLPSRFPLAYPQHGYITRYADVPAFSTVYSVRGTFRRMVRAGLPLTYCLRMTVWWFLRVRLMYRRELAF